MFTSRNEFAAAGAGREWSGGDIALPLSMPESGGSFAEQYAGVKAEVARFISEGGADGAAQISPEGWRARQKIEAAGGGEVLPADRQAFVDEMMPFAASAAAKLGVAPSVVLAHAALESGWGRKPVLRADGGSSHNLFGIKAGAGWHGGSAASLTTEFIDGKQQARVESFRSYPDYHAAFDDYAELLRSNPRYRGALGRGGDVRAFAQALQRGGYATDPAYAGKLAGVAESLLRR
ncbi:flagellar assembly peptidoglycan hydrolase FlgJ [Chromobacterium sp. IIBBL 290-4]|uniref:flagellar assembly peptidoglycan hydrolase FlgJ n=1 Tax=Chromobacterium sp. IIBBL 290-4 TaxID=2953890 RepID=UPI0020B72419|nr:flagellar assembly peptidoglycan hydrolase FlgJ [Chromobacterium sp. IIBBL 290-4]UTH73161.1 flagellar assembly peptidoglycan hydrolase FlgJ [Chromobacterium sp. IIBBL 290-4]